jgi:hypothetical protein
MHVVALTGYRTHDKQTSSITGYGAIHAAILSMAARVFRSGLSISGFQPLTEAELLNAQTPDEGLCLSS